MKRKPGKIHAATDRSARLQALVRVLMRRPSAGATTHEIAQATGDLAVHSTVAELRHRGYRIGCRYERRTAAGRKVYRYRLDWTGGAA